MIESDGSVVEIHFETDEEARAFVEWFESDGMYDLKAWIDFRSDDDGIIEH